MAYKLNAVDFGAVIEKMSTKYRIYAPCKLFGWGTFSDADIVGYSQIQSAGQIVFDEKSMYSFKEAILPISQTMFYFTEDEMKEPKAAYEQAVVFLRGCELHALGRLDDIYRSDGKLDFYYEQLRSNAKFIVMGCGSDFEGCFCESMGTNVVADYDAYIIPEGDSYIIDSRCDDLTGLLEQLNIGQVEFTPKDVTNTRKVTLPREIPDSIAESPIWDEYDARCIACGRCNFVCPTCTCFTAQDIFYDENPNTGERRRVWASCHVDGYTDIAGGMSFRKTNAERMRFRVLHKIRDHKTRYGRNMCVGCGRCDDVCPEYISLKACIGKVRKACKEVSGNG